jgi:protein tyrosine phosphatase (PTP) superfamily phosphohydrolase (DUF442 family)
MAGQKCNKAKRARLRYILILAAAVLVVLAGAIRYWVKAGNSSSSTYQSPGVQAETTREEKWAVWLELPGLPNFHKVSDDLYRGAQPTAEGMRQLKVLGIKTVVNLRSFHSDRKEIGSTGLGYEHIYMKAWHPEDKEVVRFLQIVTDEARTPVFVHCQHGADRTGTMCAIYRIAVQGWSKQEAVDEMTKGGFGFHGIWANLLDYLRDLDIDEMKRRAGLNE